MMPIVPLAVTTENLSTAWATVFGRLTTRGVDELGPVTVSVTGFDNEGLPEETAIIRAELDAQLKQKNKKSIITVANTIFPQRLWRMNEANSAEMLFRRYNSIWPRVRRHPANRRGVYFQRLTAFTPACGTDNALPVNQLARIIEIYQSGNLRRSALQAGIFDPTRDHVNVPVLGFPCLQQLAFTPIDGQGLAVTGFYATQYHFEKAYGNYLGLCWLGRFMAKQLGLRLVRMTCTATRVIMGELNKTEARDLATRIAGPGTAADEETALRGA